jgi:hypothetical protein
METKETNTCADAEKIPVMTRFTAGELEVVRSLTGVADNAGAVCAYVRRSLIAAGFTTAAGAPVEGAVA